MHLRNRYATSLATACCGLVAALLTTSCSGSGANMISLVEPPVTEPTAVATTLPLTLDPQVTNEVPLPTPVDISEPAAFVDGSDAARSDPSSNGPGAKAKRSTSDG